MRKISYCPNAMHLIVVIVMHLTVVILPLQRSFDPSSIPFKTLRGLDKHIRNAMLPGADIRTLDLKKPRPSGWRSATEVLLCQSQGRVQTVHCESGLSWQDVHAV